MSGPGGVGKAEIARRLSDVFGYTRYLEITTTTTGARYADARAAGYALCERLVYRRNHDVADGLPVDFSSAGDDISGPAAQIRAAGRQYDVILVDPHHTYACSARDLRFAFSLLGDGGALVVHDCDPPTREIAVPDFIPGGWCGVTYKAFVDFVLDNAGLNYLTVDSDFGCGVVFKRPPRVGWRRLGDGVAAVLRGRRSRALSRLWRSVGEDYDRAFDVFAGNRVALLRLVRGERFLALTSRPPVAPAIVRWRLLRAARAAARR